jgi:hypothetical protein
MDDAFGAMGVAWEGRGKPPGVGHTGQPVSGGKNTDYKIESAAYFLRPEVRIYRVLYLIRETDC